MNQLNPMTSTWGGQAGGFALAGAFAAMRVEVRVDVMSQALAAGAAGLAGAAAAAGGEMQAGGPGAAAGPLVSLGSPSTLTLPPAPGAGSQPGGPPLREIACPSLPTSCPPPPSGCPPASSGGSSCLPGATPWSHGDAPIQGAGFSSITDPIETTGDGLRFDNKATGDFVKLASASGDLMLQTRQEHGAAGNTTGMTFNTAVGAKLGKDVVTLDAAENPTDLANTDGGKTFTINGEKRTLRANETIDLPDGGQIRNEGKITLTSPKGDQIRLSPGGLMGPQGNFTYFNIDGELAPTRKDGEVRGSLGAFDADTDAVNDLVGRQGEKMPDMDTFLDTWRVGPEEDLLGGLATDRGPRPLSPQMQAVMAQLGQMQAG